MCSHFVSNLIEKILSLAALVALSQKKIIVGLSD